MDEVQSIAGLMAAGNLMLSGLGAHAEAVSRMSLDTAFISDYAADLQQFIDLNSEQQALKARLMEKTKERQAAQQKLYNGYRRARKIVKLALPNETWREFGIVDQF